MIPTKFIIVAACAAAAATWYLRQPTRTKIPDDSAPVASVRPQLERLSPRERVLVAGYLLRKRGEVISLSQRDEGPFTARTFGDAIKLQTAFLAAHNYAPGAILRIGLEDRALRPLREAVELVNVKAATTTRRQVFNIHPESSTRYGGPDAVAEEDKPLLKVTYFLRNLTDGPVEVTGVVNVRKAKRAINDLGMLASCFFESKSIAPRMTEPVECSNLNRPYVTKEDQEMLDSSEADRHLVWTPREVRLSNGTTLKFNENAAANGLLWDFYAPEKVD